MLEVDVISKDFIYDIETYPNCFTFCIVRNDNTLMRVYEISDRKKDIEGLLKCLRYLRKEECTLVGFNNIGFDYPVIHYILDKAASCKAKGELFDIEAKEIYDVAMAQIDSFKSEGFGNTVPTAKEWIRQMDLYKIWHFDNKAKTTSLKMLEFNMRRDSIQDLPFSVGLELTNEQKDVLVEYNKKDVIETLAFYNESLKAISLRSQLGEKYGIDFTNHNDTKIGKDFFIKMMEKEKSDICYYMEGRRRKIRQTKRNSIKLSECLLDYYDFKRPEFTAIKEWFAQQEITETKGVFSNILESDLGGVAKYAELTVKKLRFKGKPSSEEIAQFKKDYPLGWVEEQELKALTDKLDENGEIVYEDQILKSGEVKRKKVKVPKISYWRCWNVAETLNVVVNGFRFDYGVGGIHGSVTDRRVIPSDNQILRDEDVASYYPNLSISNKLFPEHLGSVFCKVYEDVYNQRKGYAKGTAENAAMKLALNGVYGDSNNQYSPFYDPKYTMSVTVNGQLSLCILVDMLWDKCDSMEMIMANTDGITFLVDKNQEEVSQQVCREWESLVKLELEGVNYSKMFIRDCNNYIAVYDGGVKRKGAYEYAGLDWHKNHSSLVVAMAAEVEMVYGKDAHEFIKNHEDPFDFMLRTKVPRNSKLVLELSDGFTKPLQNICRYYPSDKGGKLIKLMPPLEGKEAEGMRRLGIDKDYLVRPCNEMKDFKWDINYQYYFDQVDKLILSE